MFVNSFLPEVRKFFKVPRLHQLSENDKSLLKENEILAGFLDFLIQLLDSEALVGSDEKQRYAILQKDLTFLLTCLGDIPFQCTTELNEQVKNILAEFEFLAHEAGGFIYSFIFSTRPLKTSRCENFSSRLRKIGLIKESIVTFSEILRCIIPGIDDNKDVLAEIQILANKIGDNVCSCDFTACQVKASRFYGGRDSLLEKVGLLKEKIKEHCIIFSELPRCITPGENAIDSLFIVNSLLEVLENLMNSQRDLPIHDIKDQIKIIHEETMVARIIIKDIELQGTYKDELKESAIQIRDVAYEAEYLVNSYVAGNTPIWYFNLRLPNVSHKMKHVVIRLQEIKKICDMKFLKIVKVFNKKLSFQDMETPVDVDENILVGFEDEQNKILGDLIGGSKSRQIISIFGLPGLGKTTMAKKLYNGRSSCDYFDEHAWCVVSQTFQKRNVLVGIFMSLASSKAEKLDKENLLKTEDESLGLEIHKRLVGRRYLIVMDDVWDSNIWYDLRRYFPDDVNESRIILTSRVRDTAPTGSIICPLPLLSKVQCWDLLEKKVFSREPCPSQLLWVGKEIAAKCRGLPLAVVVIAGILKKLEEEENVWGKVKRNLDSYIFDGPSVCLKILELSYENLPNHLKRCFLYFGAFPEDAEIRTTKLTWLWIAEGFILKQEEKSPERVAEEYLFDLTNRSLVMVAQKRSSGSIKTCNVHDLLHDMCLRKAHDENFLKYIKKEFSVYEKHQRLYIHSTLKFLRCFGLRCRSFFGSLSDPSPGFLHMPLLRVMDLVRLKVFYPSTEEIYLLVNLRYLSIPELPHPTVDNFVNLEILCLESNATLKLSFILKMVKLRHLHCKFGIRFEKDCDTYQTTNLRSLRDVCIDNHEDEEILRHSPYLLKLKCRCEGAVFPYLRSLIELETLNMSFYGQFKGELTNIYFPSTFKKLTLSGLGLPWEEISIIGRLPNLHYLRLFSKAFVGEVWETKDDEFLELRFLTLDYNPLKHLFAGSDHFPKLQCLKLNHCLNLRGIPNDLGNILQTIEVDYCGYEASISAVRIELEQREYGNEELKVIINNFYWSKEQLVKECNETS